MSVDIEKRNMELPMTQIIQPNKPQTTQGEDNPQDNKGMVNSGFEQQELSPPTPETPPALTYMDFLPEFINPAVDENSAPEYEPFSYLVEKANLWLKINKEFTVWKCETIYYHLLADDKVDHDSMFFKESSYGINKFIFGLRMWLVPRPSDTIPVVQIGFTTALPGKEEAEYNPMRTQISLSDVFGNIMSSFRGTPDVVTGTENMSRDQNKDLTETVVNINDKMQSSENSDPQPSMYPQLGVLPQNIVKNTKENKDILEEMSKKTIVMPAKVNINLGIKMPELLMNVNKMLARKPLPGFILNTEVVPMRQVYEYSKPVVIDPDMTCWVENGSMSRIFVNALRIFYIHSSKPEFATIGYHDEHPSMKQMGVSLRFGPFQDLISKTGNWLKKQRDLRVVNMQSVVCKCAYNTNSMYQLETDATGFIEQSGMESRYAKVLRTFYIKIKSPGASETPYKSLQLTTKLFAPHRNLETNTFETMPQTMLKVIKWMRYTNIPPFCVETVPYIVFLGGYNENVVYEDRVDVTVQRTTGRQLLNTIRLYLPLEFQEPPPEKAPEPEAAEGYYSWGCVLS